MAVTLPLDINYTSASLDSHGRTVSHRRTSCNVRSKHWRSSSAKVADGYASPSGGHLDARWFTAKSHQPAERSIGQKLPTDLGSVAQNRLCWLVATLVSWNSELQRHHHQIYWPHCTAKQMFLIVISQGAHTFPHPTTTDINCHILTGRDCLGVILLRAPAAHP